MQRIVGTSNVQVQNVADSTITVLIDGGKPRRLPMERAHVPLAPHVTSPARLLTARAALVPWTGRTAVVDALTHWVKDSEPYAVKIIGGDGGTGKTRLAVQLCRPDIIGADWTAGLLQRTSDAEQLETLTDTPTPRLVVIDYAETRTEQLELLLPALAASASTEYPVRVLLLVRTRPQGSDDWSSALRQRGPLLEDSLDQATQLVLQDVEFSLAERDGMFRATATALSQRLGHPDRSKTTWEIPDLAGTVYDTPLMVSIAAYLWICDADTVDLTRTQLLASLINHENEYWSITAGPFHIDSTLRQRIVALMTLAGADTEHEAADLLRLLPDLDDATSERRRSLARWAHTLYPGNIWWNPIEPDLLGEYLASSNFAHERGVLTGVLQRTLPTQIIRPLEVLSRAALDYPYLAETLTTVVSERVTDLCKRAIEQAEDGSPLDSLLGTPTVAAALSTLLEVIHIGTDELKASDALMPPGQNIVLGPLALVLAIEHTHRVRQDTEQEPTPRAGQLPSMLTTLAARLAFVGRFEEALASGQEAVALYLDLATTKPAAYTPDLARSLNNLASHLANVGRRDDALAPIHQAVALYLDLATANAAYTPDLADSLHNLAAHLAVAGRPHEALAVSLEAVGLHRTLAAASPAAHTPDLAGSLHNLASCLAAVGRPDAAIAPIHEAVTLYRELAAASPAAYTPELAKSLSTLASRLAAVGRPDEAIAPIHEAVTLRRILAATSPTAYTPDLAKSLTTLANRLAAVGRPDEAIAPIHEALTLYRDLAAASPTANTPDLARALHNVAVHLVSAGRPYEALTRIQEAVALRRALAAASPTAYTLDLARSLNNLSTHFAAVGRNVESKAAARESDEILKASGNNDAV